VEGGGKSGEGEVELNGPQDPVRLVSLVIRGAFMVNRRGNLWRRSA